MTAQPQTSSPPQTFTVPGAYCGPPESGNGGWTSGHLAALVPTTAQAPAVTVRLRTPPPLDTPMAVRRQADGSVEVLHGKVLVATGHPAPAPEHADLPDPVPFAQAAAVAEDYAGLREHPFPTCFSCGVARPAGDGLGLRPAALPGRGGLHAAAWVPQQSTVEVVWSALDCPGAWALGFGGRPMVLGTMTALVQRLPVVGQEHVVLAWGRGGEGRKHYCGTALYAADGTLLAQADATWVAIDPSAVRPAGPR